MRINIIISTLLICLTISQLSAQKATQVALAGVTSPSIGSITNEEASALFRLELEKMDSQFYLIDKYETLEKLEANNLSTINCLSKSCMQKVGKALKANQVVAGSIETTKDKIIISARLLSVRDSSIIKSVTMDFTNNTYAYQEMIRISLRKLFGYQVPSDREEILTNPNSPESAINNPNTTRLKLNGPRIGGVFLSGPMVERLQSSKEEGGADLYSPTMTVFAYQYETQYLNEGNFQALIEFIPAVIGLDQNLFIPSFTFLNGFRSNSSGWEFALGPIFNFVPLAKGYRDSSNTWVKTDIAPDENTKLIKTYDRRGAVTLQTSFMFAVGKSFKTGRLNLPISAYYVPGKEVQRFGLVFGFTSRQ